MLDFEDVPSDFCVRILHVYFGEPCFLLIHRSGRCSIWRSGSSGAKAWCCKVQLRFEVLYFQLKRLKFVFKEDWYCLEGLYSKGKSRGKGDFEEGQRKSWDARELCLWSGKIYFVQTKSGNFSILLRFCGTYLSVCPYLLFAHNKQQFILSLIASHSWSIRW